MSSDRKQQVLTIFISAVLSILATLGIINLADVIPFPTPDSEARVRERISIDARDDAYLYNGADLIVYSDNHTTEKARIDGATGNLTANNVTVNGTFIPAGAFDLNGAAMAIDADGNTTLQASGDDLALLTTGAATGTLNVLVGNLKVGNGTPAVTLDGEDLYVEGTSEFDGAGQFDGAMRFNSTISQATNSANFGVMSVITTAITYTAAAGGSGIVVTIPDNQTWLIHKVFVRTTTNFDATGDDATLIIGDDLDVDGFLAANDAALQAAFTEATGFEPGFYGIENGSGGAYTTDDGGPFVYLQSGAAQTIDWVVGESSGTTLAAGAATIYVLYTRVQ